MKESDRPKIKDLLVSKEIGKEFLLKGWVRTKRGNKNIDDQLILGDQKPRELASPSPEGLRLIIKMVVGLLLFIFAIGMYVRINVLIEKVDILTGKIDEGSIITEVIVNGEQKLRRVFLIGEIK